MTTVMKSVTRVLSELKAIDEKLGNPASFGAVAGFTVGQGTNRQIGQGFGGDLPKNPVEARSKIQGNIDTIVALLDRRGAMKSALVQSNAKTHVSIAGRSVTVAEAIELKSRVASMEQLLQYVKGNVAQANRAVETADRVMETMIQTQVQSLLSSAADKTGIAEITAQLAVPIRAQKTPTAETSAATTFIETFGAEVEALKTEIDFVLSESNAKTTIFV